MITLSDRAPNLILAWHTRTMGVNHRALLYSSWASSGTSGNSGLEQKVVPEIKNITLFLTTDQHSFRNANAFNALSSPCQCLLSCKLAPSDIKVWRILSTNIGVVRFWWTVWRASEVPSFPALPQNYTLSCSVPSASHRVTKIKRQAKEIHSTGTELCKTHTFVDFKAWWSKRNIGIISKAKITIF